MSFCSCCDAGPGCDDSSDANDVCRAEYMIATLKMIKEQFGSAEGYVVEKCGLTKEEVEKIRKNLVVDEPAIHEKSQHTL